LSFSTLHIPTSLFFHSRFGLEFGYSKPPCGSLDPKPPQWWYTYIDSVHYLHFGFLLFLITGAVSILVSLVTEPIPGKDASNQL
jgi:hypothetical protein